MDSGKGQLLWSSIWKLGKLWISQRITLFKLQKTAIQINWCATLGWIEFLDNNGKQSTAQLSNFFIECVKIRVVHQSVIVKTQAIVPYVGSLTRNMRSLNYGSALLRNDSSVPPISLKSKHHRQVWGPRTKPKNGKTMTCFTLLLIWLYNTISWKRLCNISTSSLLTGVF